MSSSDMSSSGVRCGCGPSGEDMGSAAVARSGGGTGAGCAGGSVAALFLLSFCRGWRGTWGGGGCGIGVGFRRGSCSPVVQREYEPQP